MCKYFVLSFYYDQVELLVSFNWKKKSIFAMIDPNYIQNKTNDLFVFVFSN